MVFLLTFIRFRVFSVVPTNMIGLFNIIMFSVHYIGNAWRANYDCYGKRFGFVYLLDLKIVFSLTACLDNLILWIIWYCIKPMDPDDATELLYTIFVCNVIFFFIYHSVRRNYRQYHHTKWCCCFYRLFLHTTLLQVCETWCGTLPNMVGYNTLWLAGIWFIHR